MPFQAANPQLLDHVEWVETGRSYQLSNKQSTSHSHTPDPAILHCVGELSPNKFYLLACGGWDGERGPQNVWTNPTPIHKAKARCRVRSPGLLSVDEQWSVTLKNLTAIMRMPFATSSLPLSRSLLDVKELLVRHSLFRVSKIPCSPAVHSFRYGQNPVQT
jgi:hypothetical protein